MSQLCVVPMCGPGCPLPLAWMGMPGWAEILIIAFVGLLIFGRRLPEVGRSLGKSIVEFKRGVREAKDQIDIAATIDDASKTALPASRPSPPPVAESPPVTEPAEQTNSSSTD